MQLFYRYQSRPELPDRGLAKLEGWIRLAKVVIVSRLYFGLPANEKLTIGVGAL